ncbi:MAG TPA: proteasome accessory factor PafA2 family protein [Candidatus Paceibacterota bacterium]|nr:proteasome accessory factor PafA2 family protein [Verrucomicrobiota bacterium]HSA09336.1 proteasome accessory factor PafA2 family protein [Candidatus Paceibacterota bacterium]
MSNKPVSRSTALGLSDAGAAPKLLGADVELGNFILGVDDERGTGEVASRALLREIEGLPFLDSGLTGAWWDQPGQFQSAGTNPQDWGRKFLPVNGGAVYIDLAHLEWCAPEILNAYDFAAATHAMLRIVRAALQAANAKLPEGLKLVVVVNNQDGQGHSYGSHLNVLMTRAAWNRLFHRRLHELLMLASFQVSSIILTGQGMVNSGRGNGGESNGWYELSQRASFFECLVGPQTTYNRPLVNSRDEALCGSLTSLGSPADRFARLHSIFFDATLCPASIVLRAGLMQIMLGLLERDETGRHLELILDDPVETVARWSRDPSLTARAGLLTGEQVTALELQRRFFDQAARFVESGGCEGIVPAARGIMELWGDTLDKLGRRDFAALATRLDWVLKLQLLQRAMHQHPKLNWGSPEIKHLDFKYADLGEGLFWACDQAGAVDHVGVSEEQVRKFTQEPPVNTRAWTRAHLLRLADPATVAEVDWDKITFEFRGLSGAGFRRTVRLANPLAFTRDDTEVVFRRSEDLHEALDLLDAPACDPQPVYAAGQYWVASNYQPANATSPQSDRTDESGNDQPPHSKL